MHALTGSGEKLNQMDPATSRGLHPEAFANKMVRAIEKKKEEVYIGGSKEVFAIYLKRFLPGLFSRIIRKAKVR
jgi:short-subunit dehydrogenase